MLILLPTPGTHQAVVRKIERRYRSLRAVMNVVSSRLEKAARRNIEEGGRPVPWPVSQRVREEGGKTLIYRRTLINSLRRSHNEERATVYTRLKYARIHEFGGVILPVEAKMLAVPIAKEARNKRPREFSRKSTFILKREGKDPLIMLKLDGGGVLPLYVLKDSVTMPARPFIKAPAHDVEECRELVAGAIIGKKT